MWKLVLSATALALVGLALHATPSAERGAERPSGKLVLGLVPPERLAVVDVRTGRTVSRRVPGGTLCRALLATGDRVIFAGVARGGSSAMALGLDLKGRPRRLGAMWDFFPSATTGRVWLAGLGRKWNAFRSLREVAVHGGTISVSRHRSPGVNVVGALEDGLLIERDGTLRVWDPRNGKVARRIRAPWAIAARGRRIAWCRGRCRTLHVSAPAGEITIRSRRSMDSRGFFSPDGSLLAMPVGTRIVLVDLVAKSTHAVPRARLTSYGALAWSPSGKWLYFAAPRHRLMAYRPGDARPVALKAHVRGSVLQLMAAG